MGMTITEKIFARHCAKETVASGDLLEARIDIALANDITGPIAIEKFYKTGALEVFDKSRVVYSSLPLPPNTSPVPKLKV